MELSRYFNAHSLGEVRYARRHLDAGYRKCSCGADFSDCPFWSGYDSLLNDVSVLEHNNVLGSLAMAFSGTSRQQIKNLFDSLYERSSPRKVLVDSSKTSWGAFLRPTVIACALRHDVNIVFVGIYRNPLNVLDSLMRGSNEEMDNSQAKSILSENKRIVSPVLKLIAGWTHANLAVLVNVVALKLMGQTAHVYAYEDVVENFDMVTKGCALESKPDLELQNHLIGGNRLAGDSKARIKPVSQKPSTVSPLLRMLVSTVLAPINLAMACSRVRGG